MKVYVSQNNVNELNFLRIINNELTFNFLNVKDFTISNFNYLKGSLIKDFFVKNHQDIIFDRVLNYNYLIINEEVYEEIINLEYVSLFSIKYDYFMKKFLPEFYI
jgi:hypothetical protein